MRVVAKRCLRSFAGQRLDTRAYRRRAAVVRVRAVVPGEIPRVARNSSHIAEIDKAKAIGRDEWRNPTLVVAQETPCGRVAPEVGQRVGRVRRVERDEPPTAVTHEGERAAKQLELTGMLLPWPSKHCGERPMMVDLTLWPCFSAVASTYGLNDEPTCAPGLKTVSTWLRLGSPP